MAAFAKRLRRGSWRRQSLAHCLDLLLPIADTSHNTALATNPIPSTHSDTITHWLPTFCSIATSQASLDNDTDSVTGPDVPLTDTFTYEDQDSNDDSSPTTSVNPQPAALPILHTVTAPKASPSTMDISKINTQNAHGLWCRARDRGGNIIPNCQCDTTKLEHLIHKMRVDDIDAWLVQEKWLEDDDFDTDIEGYHLFRHNSPIGATGRDHLFRGIAIILSPRYFLAWKAAGSPTSITTKSTGDFAGQFIGLNLKEFDCLNNSGKQIKGKSLYIFLASVYHPCHDTPHEQFNEHLTSILLQVPQNSKLIMGADINAKVG